jgi:exodeoxyribonuclease VII large subunit
MRGRHAAELSHALARIVRSQAAGRDRRVQQLQRRLDACDLGKRFAAIHARLATAEGRLTSGMVRRLHHAESRLRNCAGRLETLSPLAVLGRGYAVCWNADRTRALRDAALSVPGDRVRVTLARGELDCEVQGVESENLKPDV